MKTFKDYLTESKRSYSFRVKIADCDLDDEMLDKIEKALSAYQLNDITKPKSQPVSRYREFAKLGPVGCEMMEVVTNYPAIPPQVQQSIHAATGIPLDHIYVADLMSDNMEIDPVSDHEEAPILTKDYKGNDSAQSVVGLHRVESLLKELGKEKHGGEQHKGVNDNILAKSIPAEKAAKTSDKAPQNNKSVLKPNTTPRGK
jgi:hypothetical protein